MKSQFVMLSSGAGPGSGYGGRRYAPYAFTEQGVAMLSTVLKSERAVVINIEIMSTFVRVRTLASTQQDLAKQLSELQDKTESLAMSHETFSRNTRNQLKQVFDTLYGRGAPKRKLVKQEGDSRLRRRLLAVEKLGVAEKRQVLQLIDAFIERGQLKAKMQRQA